MKRALSFWLWSGLTLAWVVFTALAVSCALTASGRRPDLGDLFAVVTGLAGSFGAGAEAWWSWGEVSGG